jgi:hypothetical protein
VRPAQLAKHHRYKLIPAPKPTGVTVSFDLFHSPFKLVSRKKLEQLIEDAAKSIHG